MTSSPGLRLSLFYAALFSSIGIQLPFWPLYLSSKGLNASEIASLVAATYLARVVTNPLAGSLADRMGERRGPMVALALIGAVTSVGFAVIDQFQGLVLLTMISFGASTAILPLADSLALWCVVTYRLNYGRARLWGSIAFIVVASTGGYFLIDAPRPAILWALVATLVFAFVTTLFLPRGESGSARRVAGAKPFQRLLQNRLFILFLAATSLIQLSHSLYYGFATLYWRDAGLSGLVIGALWAEGVVAEVLLFAFGERLLRLWGPVWLIAAGSTAGILRWTVLGLTTDPALLACAQLLHAFTFGASHLGAMHFIHRAVPTECASASLGLYSSVTMGITPGLALLGVGNLYAYLGGPAFLAMSVAAAGGLAASITLGREWRGQPIFEVAR